MSEERPNIGLYPKKEGETVFYSPYLAHSFTLPKLDNKGKVIQKTHAQTGAPLMDSHGNMVPVEQTFRFNKWRTRFSEIGYWCVYVVTEGTSKQISDYLEAEAKNRSSQIIDEAEFIKRTNPDLARHLESDQIKDTTISAQTAEIKRLKALLDGKGKGKTEPPSQDK